MPITIPAISPPDRRCLCCGADDRGDEAAGEEGEMTEELFDGLSVDSKDEK